MALAPRHREDHSVCIGEPELGELGPGQLMKLQVVAHQYNSCNVFSDTSTSDVLQQTIYMNKSKPRMK